MRHTFQHIAIGLASVACAMATSADSPITLPGETFTARARLGELITTLDEKTTSSTATLLDALIADDGETLMGGGEKTLISVNAWLDALPSPQHAALVTAYRGKFDTTAIQQLDALRHDQRATAASLYTFAHRRRFSAAAAPAYAEAAERALDTGDLPAGYALYSQAVRGGWIAGASKSARMDSLRRIAEGSLLPLPAEPGSRQPMPFSGPLPFDASWYAATAEGPRFFPVASDDRIFVSCPSGIAAFRESGQVLWYSMPLALKPLLSEAPRGSWSAGLLSDIYGRGQIVIARQAAPEPLAGTGRFILRAVRATDGKQIWSTESQPLLKDIGFAGTPAVSGRYTYCLGIGEGADRGTLSLIALDTLDGQLFWQATLGSFSLPHDLLNGEPRPWEAIWSASEPLVAGDSVYVSPGCGMVGRIGRFDGRIRWLRPYAPTTAPPLRFRGTPVMCGNILAAAPRDTEEAFGLHVATGKLAWSLKPAPPTSIGSTPTTAIFAGPAGVEAINAADATSAWKWQPNATTPITGPAVVSTNLVLVPTQAPIIALNADDGTVSEREAGGVPFFRRALKADPTLRQLDQMGAGKAFGSAKHATN